MEEFDKKERKLKLVADWAFLILSAIFGTLLYGGGLYYLLVGHQGWIISILQKQFAAILLPPLIMVCSMVVVISLKISEGPIKFKIFGLDFEGSSSQIIMWVLVYLVFVMSIKILWVI